MALNLQKIGIDVENLNAITPASDERLEQRLGNRPGLPASPSQQHNKTMPDQEYVILMEERYGIREEGIF